MRVRDASAVIVLVVTAWHMGYQRGRIDEAIAMVRRVETMARTMGGH